VHNLIGNPMQHCAYSLRSSCQPSEFKLQKFCESIYARAGEGNMGVPPASNDPPDHPAPRRLGSRKALPSSTD
jgi:hypothetical protein